jgi:hypothetical protein
VDRELNLFHPELTEADALRCLAYEKLFLYPIKGPLLSLLEEGTDGWRRHVRIYRSSKGDVVNYFRCELTGHHYAEARGPYANNILIFIHAALAAADLPRCILVETLVSAIDAGLEPGARIWCADALCISALPVTPEILHGLTKLLEDESTRVAVAERLSYRASPEIAALVEGVAQAETDPQRKAHLTEFAEVYRTLADIGHGDAAVARFQGRTLSPFMQQLLAIGPLGGNFYGPDVPAEG